MLGHHPREPLAAAPHGWDRVDNKKPDRQTGHPHLDPRNQHFWCWFLEANLGPRCRFSSSFPNRLPSISQWSGNVDEPHFFGALFPHCEAEGRRFGKNEEMRHLGPKFASRNHPKTGWFLRSSSRPVGGTTLGAKFNKRCDRLKYQINFIVQINQIVFTAKSTVLGIRFLSNQSQAFLYGSRLYRGWAPALKR